MVDSIRDHRCHASKPNLSDSSCSGGVQLVIGVLQECDLDIGAVGMHWHDVVREFGVDGSAGTFVVLVAF